MARLGRIRYGMIGRGGAGCGKARSLLQEHRMLKVDFEIEGVSPISFSAPVASKKTTGETHDDFEQRTWRERLHVADDGQAFIPPSAIKNCLSEVAKYLGETVPGKGKATYTKHFEAGLLVTDPMMLGVKADSVQGEKLFVPASGKRGDGKRVWKTFPVLPKWKTSGVLYLLDPVLLGKGGPEKVREYLEHAGKFIGLGRFRPRNNGFYGRFRVSKFSASKVSE